VPLKETVKTYKRGATAQSNAKDTAQHG